ncbi:MAG: IS1595 family transposase [Candidatus Korobacteraceae bacterium]
MEKQGRVVECPDNLKQVIQYFSDAEACVEFLAGIRWPDGARCPACESTSHSYIKTRRIWKCKACGRQYSVKLGTVFEDSPIPLDKWLCAVWLVVNCKNGISSYEIARYLKITQKSAWFMLGRIRLALKDGDWSTKLGSADGGECEVDETFVGAKVINMHKSRRVAIQRAYGELPRAERDNRYPGKTPVQGMLDRESRKVRATVVKNVRRETLQAQVLNNIEQGSRIYTDKAVAYENLHLKYIHEVVDHAQKYVQGRVHTNGLENFWSLLKRSLKGTYVAVEPYHLERYVDEQVFRYNNRGGKKKEDRISDRDRFKLALSQIAGKRLTYAELTGKVGETPF